MGVKKSLIKKRSGSFLLGQGLSEIKKVPVQQRTSGCRADAAWAHS
jgi:hypothetical protein